MNTDGTVINKYTIMNPELCEKHNILINNVSKCDRRFVLYETVCKWKLVFEKYNSVDVKSKVMYKTSVLGHNLEKNPKK